MIDAILNYWANPWIAVFLYWLPLMVCAIGYTVRTFENYHKDVIHRKEYIDGKNAATESRSLCNAPYYSPTDKIGTLIGRALVTFIPFANLWAASFDVSPRLFRRIFERIEKIFDQPLVPHPK